MKRPPFSKVKSITRKSEHINLYGEDAELLNRVRIHMQDKRREWTGGKTTKAHVVRIALTQLADKLKVNLSK